MTSRAESSGKNANSPPDVSSVDHRILQPLISNVFSTFIVPSG
jgi:hypothetical protein